MSNNSPTYFQLAAKLAKFRNKNAGAQAGTAIFKFAIRYLFLFLLLFAIEAVFKMPTTGRIVALIAALIIGITLLVIQIILPGVGIFRYIQEPLFKTAMHIGRALKSVNDRLANALQIYENFERDKDRYSISLIEASLESAANDVKSADFDELVDFSLLKKAIYRTVLAGMVFVVFGFVFFSSFSAAGHRLAHPTIDFSHENKVSFFISPGETNVIKGQDVPLAVVLSDSTFESVSLSLTSESTAQTIQLVKSNDDSFRHVIENIRQDSKYTFSAAKQSSDEFLIKVIERPMLRSLSLKIEPPAYAEINPYVLDENFGDISALKGSRVIITGTANKTLKSASLDFLQGTSLKISTNDRRVTAHFRVSLDDSYSIRLRDEAGNENASPIEYKIRVLPDNFPIVQIISPGEDIDLDDNMIIPLIIEAQDDFGISKLRLAYQMLPSGEGELDSSRFVFSDIQGISKNEDQVRIALNWDLSEIGMYPTDVLVYYVEAYDNDDISGPKYSKSEMYRARFPSLYEMYEETTFEQEDATDTFEQALERSKELQQKLEDMSQEMKRSSEMDWQKKQEMEDAVSRQKEIEQQLDEAMQQMDEMIEQIEKNNLFTEETMQKLEEIQSLYKEIMTPELQDIMQDMNEAMQNLDEKLMREAMEKFKLNVQDYNESLDRTISLLKKLQAEQKLDQALKMAQDLEERQSQVGEQAEKSQADNERLAKEQERISKDADNLSGVLDQLQKEMEKVPASPMEQIEQAANQMQQDNLQQNLSELEQKLSQNQMSSVPQQSSQAQQSFQKMADNLEQAQQMMSGEMQRQAMQAMRKSSRELLQLSQQQENLMQKMQGLSRTSPQYMDIAEQQQQAASSLQRLVDGMAETMKSNFGIDPKVSESLGKASMAMENALNSLANRDGKKASQSQGQSMAQMNAAVRGMQQSMQNMMQQQGGSGGMSYQQFMQQMQRMADQQGQLNQQSQAMGNPGQLSMGQQASMMRLAAQQGQLRKSMQQMAQEAAGMSEILGSLEKIAEDMQKVEEDFANKNVTRDTYNRQNRILSRMLDSQRSVNKREFSRERQAETGKRYSTKSPQDLPSDFGERKNQLQQDLLRAKKEGYSRDYLKVIENYFKALTEHEMAE
jgi:hypothetical protein